MISDRTTCRWMFLGARWYSTLRLGPGDKGGAAGGRGPTRQAGPPHCSLHAPAHLLSHASTAGSPASTACRTLCTFSSSQLMVAGSFQRKCDLPRYRLTSWLRAGGWLWAAGTVRPHGPAPRAHWCSGGPRLLATWSRRRPPQGGCCPGTQPPGQGPQAFPSV